MYRLEVKTWLTYDLFHNNRNVTCTGIVWEYLCKTGKGSKNLPRWGIHSPWKVSWVCKSERLSPTESPSHMLRCLVWQRGRSVGQQFLRYTKHLHETALPGQARHFASTRKGSWYSKTRSRCLAISEWEASRLKGKTLQKLTEGNSIPVFKYAVSSERKELKSMADGLHLCSIRSTCCFIHSSKSCGDGSVC
jgi:hypothetical protein